MTGYVWKMHTRAESSEWNYPSPVTNTVAFNKMPIGPLSQGLQLSISNQGKFPSSTQRSLTCRGRALNHQYCTNHDITSQTIVISSGKTYP